MRAGLQHQEEICEGKELIIRDHRSPPMQTYNQPQFRWIDFIRALGAFLVVLAHVEYKGPGADLTGTFYYALTRVAVPLFFMASGFLLLSKQEPYLEFFRKRLFKVFVPFIIWSVIYLVWKGENLDLPFLSLIKTYILRIIRGPRENHLWFFYELFGLYLFTPILRVYLQKASMKDLIYFCGLWFVLTPCVILILEFTPLQIGFTYYFLGGYIGYFLFGYLITRLQLNPRHKMIAFAVFFVMLLVSVAAIYLSSYYGIRTQYFGDYLSVNVVLMSCALFVALVDLPVSDPAYRFIQPVSRASFGIYLVHVIVMVELFSISPFSGWSMLGTAIFMIPLMGLLGFVLSFLLIFILQKVPVLRSTVP